MTPDLFGLEPVYESDAGEFGSDPRSLTRSRALDDEEALAGYLTLSHIPSPRTIFADVRRVMASPALDGLPPMFDKMPPAVDVLSLLRDSVQTRRKGEATVGIFLSGGLDSSVVAALLLEVGVKVIAFTLDFGPDAFGETDWAEAVAAHLKIPLRKVPCGSRDVAGAWEPAAKARGRPRRW